jgi:phosphonoacetaldehyde hydrolase
MQAFPLLKQHFASIDKQREIYMTFRYQRRYTGKLQGAIFDWAGTTIDYGCFAPTRVFMEGFTAQGVEITLAEARAPMGKAKRDHITEIMNMPRVTTAWQEAHGVLPTDDDVQRIYEEFLPRQIAVVGDYAELIPGTIEMVSALRERGMVIGSCTGYTRSIMEAVIPVAKENGYEPDCIVTSDEVSQARPAPWMALKIAEQMRIYPLEAWVKVGDTVTDIEEGINAGMWTIGILKTGNELGMDLEAVQSLSREDIIERLRPICRYVRPCGTVLPLF